jgi:peptidyl-prolyl cis-trans isomerase D
MGYPVERLGPFTRVTAPSHFVRNPMALGAAFGLRPGEKSDVVTGEAGSFLLQVLVHQNADSSAWFKQRAQQRETLMRPLVQARVQQYLAALRADAKIVDRRSEIYRSTANSGGS